MGLLASAGVLVVVLLLQVAVADDDDVVVLKNNRIVLEFHVGNDDKFGRLRKVSALGASPLITDVSSSPLWTAQFVDTSTLLSASSADKASRSYQRNGEILSMKWDTLKVGTASVTVEVMVRLPSNATEASFYFTFNGDGTVGLWQWGVTVGSIPVSPSYDILENHGFGILHECGRRTGKVGSESSDETTCEWSSQYNNTYIPTCPDGSTSGCPFYMTLTKAKEACNADSRCTGVTHSKAWYELRGGLSPLGSPSGETSWLITNVEKCHPGFSPSVSCGDFSNGYPSGTYQFLSLHDNSRSTGNGLYFGSHDPQGASKSFSCAMQQQPPHPTATFTISQLPPGSGTPLKSYISEYPFVLAVFDGDWWDAAQIYRRWALPNAQWTKKGPTATRPDVPKWLYNVTTWVNSHWQGRDIFNTSGGDPTVVKNRVKAIHDRFGLEAGATLGLHWYEWDTLGYKEGSNYTECESEMTCGFDTHYPEYFPTRANFNESLKAMQEIGVRVAPYINGRIFDVGTKSWTRDNAVRFTAKQTAYPALRPDPSPTSLEPYEESYGSLATFNVMCPHTAYWQDVIASTTGRIVKGLGTDGVYIDQIASAGPAPCYDPTHNHTIGGGSHWVTGYRAMLDQARAKAGNDAVFLTESNAEPFMDGVNLYLTLVGFISADFTGNRHIVNTFGAIYGGYYLSVGAEFFQPDLTQDPDVFAAKVAQQLMFGAQLGWFSLGGRDNQDPEMGLFDLLMDHRYTPEVNYLRALSNARQAVQRWMIEGQPLRPLPIDRDQARFRSIPVPRASKGQEREGQVGLIYDTLMSSCWLAPEATNFVCLFTAVSKARSESVTAVIDATKYGLKADRVAVSSFPDGKPIGTYPATEVHIKASVPSRSIVILRFTVA